MLIRLIGLLIEISELEKIHQKNIVYDLLHELFLKTDRHQILLRIVKELHEHSSFKTENWFRDLLNHENRDTREMCLYVLWLIASESPEKVFDLFDMIITWHPKEDVDSADYSTLNNYSLIFILSYLNTEFYRVEKEENNLGSHPNSYSLFYSHSLDENLIDNIVKIIDWLFSAKLKYACWNISNVPFDDLTLKKIEDTILLELGIIQANTLESWFRVLESEEEPIDSDSSSFSEQLIQKVSQQMSSRNLKYIHVWWGVRIKQFNSEILENKTKAKLGLKTNNKIASIKAKRDFLYKLKKRLMEAYYADVNKTS